MKTWGEVQSYPTCKKNKGKILSHSTGEPRLKGANYETVLNEPPPIMVSILKDTKLS